MNWLVSFFLGTPDERYASKEGQALIAAKQACSLYFPNEIGDLILEYGVFNWTQRLGREMSRICKIEGWPDIFSSPINRTFDSLFLPKIMQLELSAVEPDVIRRVLSWVRKMGRLNEIHLPEFSGTRESQISQYTLYQKVVTQCPRIRSVVLEQNLDLEGLDLISKIQPQLTSLWIKRSQDPQYLTAYALSRNGNISILKEVLSRLTKLQVLKLNGEDVVDDHLKVISEKCTQIRELSMIGESRVSPAAISSCLSALTHLTSLDVNGLSKFTRVGNRSPLPILGGLSSLTYLNMSRIKIFSLGLGEIAYLQTTSLIELRMQHCFDLPFGVHGENEDDRGLYAALSKISSLQILDLTGCQLNVKFFLSLLQTGNLRTLSCGGVNIPFEQAQIEEREYVYKESRSYETIYECRQQGRLSVGYVKKEKKVLYSADLIIQAERNPNLSLHFSPDLMTLTRPPSPVSNSRNRNPWGFTGRV